MTSATSESGEANLAAARGNYVMAVRLWRHLADKGDPVAQFNLGFSYAQGHGVPRDRAEAAKWYRLAAEQGHADAQYRLGLYCETNDASDATEEVTHRYFKNEDEAGKWISQAAMQGHTEALIWLAESAFEYAAEIDPYTEVTGEGVEDAKYRKKNASDDATGSIMEAAEQGHAVAQFALGQHYKYRTRDLKEEEKEDFAEAANWYQKAAVQGHLSARVSLGDMFMKGEGIRQDFLQAYKWFDLAASCEENPKVRAYAVDLRAVVAQKMTPEQIAEARRLAQEWKPK